MKKSLLALVVLVLSIQISAKLNIKEATKDIFLSQIILDPAFSSYKGCRLDMNVEAVPANIFYKSDYSSKMHKVSEWSYDLDSGYVSFFMDLKLVGLSECSSGYLGLKFYVN